ncbi:hypothetical protein [Paenibacillus graminis]|uniref:hypothetical protein n=1 Tax=Paenibacillus graminis TaxID=189425 RepID=UPI000471DB25|nr:hypothetical protein [Paenibacillus graminis]
MEDASTVPMFDISRERKHQSCMPTRHYHNGYEIFYLVSGDVCYFIEDKAYQVVGGVACQRKRRVL